MSNLGTKVSRLSAGTRARQNHRTAVTTKPVQVSQPEPPVVKVKPKKKTKKGRK